MSPSLSHWADAPAFGNRLLDGLPSETRHVLHPHMREEPLYAGQHLIEPGRQVEQAYFPIHGVVSLLTMTSDGASAQTAMVGREGMLPVCVALGRDVSSQKAVVQIAGMTLAINTAKLQHQMNTHVALKRVLLSYAQILLDAVAQTAVCNSVHLLEQRCARWLLMAHDRVPGDEIRITHEALARLLAARRPGITVAAKALQDRGLIAYHRGTISVRDRQGLEAAACECDSLIARHAATAISRDAIVSG